MIEWIQKQLNEHHDRQVEYQRRVDQLTASAEKYSIGRVLDRVRNDVLQLKPSRIIYQPFQKPSGSDTTYDIVTGIDHRKGKLRKEPIFRAAIIETSWEAPRGRGDDRPSRHPFHLDHCVITFTEDGEFDFMSDNRRPVRLGTTSTIKGSDDLLAAVKDQIKREGKR